MASKKNPPGLKTIGDLHEDPENPRAIEPEALEGLKTSLASFGDISGITFNETTQELVSGHQRLKALRAKYGDLEIERLDDGRLRISIPDGDPIFIRLVKWDKSRQRMANIAANNPAIAGAFTPELQGQLKLIREEEEGMFAALRLNILADDVKLKAGGDSEKPEIAFSEELDEASNYVVLKCDTKTDFLQVQTLLGLSTVHSRRRNGKPWSAGIGRVMKWEDALAKLRGSHAE